MLVHGFGEDSHIWDQQVRFLKNSCLVIIPDLPGSGGSSILQREILAGDDQSSSLFISLMDYADCIHAVLQQEQIDRCIMLGHSMGGYITMAFAEKYPGRLNGIGLIHSTAAADTEEKKQLRERGISVIGQYGASSFLKTTIPSLFGTRFLVAQPGKVNDLIKAGASFTKEVLQQYYLAMQLRPDRRGVLESNPLPVLFVIGTEDRAAPLQDVLPQTYLPNKSYIHILQGSGHMGMLEAADQVNNWMRDFINL